MPKHNDNEITTNHCVYKPLLCVAYTELLSSGFG